MKKITKSIQFDKEIVDWIEKNKNKYQSFSGFVLNIIVKYIEMEDKNKTNEK